MRAAKHYAEFATVTGTIAAKTEKALLLSINSGPSKWIPLFRLEVASRALLYRTEKGSEVSVRVQLQFALREGLV